MLINSLLTISWWILPAQSHNLLPHEFEYIPNWTNTFQTGQIHFKLNKFIPNINKIHSKLDKYYHAIIRII